MPVKVPLHGVTIQRKDDDGNLRNVHPPIGKPFEFTDREVATFANSGVSGGTLKDPPRGQEPVKAADLMAETEHIDPPNDAKPAVTPGKVKPGAAAKVKPGAPAEDEDDGL